MKTKHPQQLAYHLQRLEEKIADQERGFAALKQRVRMVKDLLSERC